MRFTLAAALILACAVGQPAWAQQAAASRPNDSALAAKLAHDAEIADQDRRSEALNAEVNARNRAITARNAAARAAFDRATADYRTAMAQHDAQVAAIAADAARVQAAYQKASDDWKAAVAACKAGDVGKCQPAGSKAAAP